MKLFKKLLPLTAIATTVAVATPLAVSCSTKSNKNLATVDIAVLKEEEYSRKVAVKPLQNCRKESDVEKIYFDDIAKNNQILVDDIFEGLQELIVNEDLPVIEWKYGLEEILDGNISINVLGVDKTNNTISFKVIFDDVRYVLEDRNDDIYYCAHINSSITFTNIPLKVYHDNGVASANTWTVVPKFMEDKWSDVDMWSLKNDKNWSISYDRNWTINLIDYDLWEESYEVEEHEEIRKHHVASDLNANKGDELLSVAVDLFDDLPYSTNYLANVYLV